MTEIKGDRAEINGTSKNQSVNKTLITTLPLKKKHKQNQHPFLVWEYRNVLTMCDIDILNSICMWKNDIEMIKWHSFLSMCSVVKGEFRSFTWVNVDILQIKLIKYK